MFFRKKKPVSTAEIQDLQARGLNERDIIKELKSRGHSYNDIEVAMMQTVKVGAVEPPIEEAADIGQMSSAKTATFEDMYTQQPLPAPAQPEAQLEVAQQTVSPEVVVEELVEGVVEEKWEKMEKRLGEMQSQLDEIKQKASVKPATPVAEISHEQEARMNTVGDQIEELQARIGGLEKAFKQFLPALTANIDNLSKLIHEMKGREGMVVEG